MTAPMRYVSLFSGIEAASVAWSPLGWEPVAFAEIDPFACAVLDHRFPEVPNLGDVSEVDWRKYAESVDVVVGGSPCQAFSVAGRREGLLDERGQLMLEYVRAVRDLRPQWLLWENMPGVLSQDGGRAFDTLLRALEECGYSLAWRVLDAQFYGVAQRRRRVFLIGHFGADVGPAAAILFDPESVSGNAQTNKEKRQELARRAKTRARIRKQSGIDSLPVCMVDGNSNAAIDIDLCGTLKVGGGAPIVAQKTTEGYIVRNLTPKECERLQGFPDDWTMVPYQGKPADECPDGPRYKACGNSMAVPVMHRIGSQIERIEALIEGRKAQI